jgi:hypothetical protein
MSKSPVKVLLVAEGEHERSGALENLVRRLGGNDASFTARPANDASVHGRHGEGTGMGGSAKRALAWLREAWKDYDALIYLIDDDEGEDRRKEQIREAQEFRKLDVPASNLPRAMGVAIRTFDAWMLADEEALAGVLGCAVARQRSPESIRKPKEICQKLLEDGMSPMAQRDMYAEIALRLRLDVLSARCPKGFTPFAERVQKVFGDGRVG